MPRNSSGIYTLPAGNPVVADTIIDVDWANPTMADIGNEITLSLPRNGSAGMTGPLTLIADAVSPLQAVPLQQLNSVVNGAVSGYLPLAGGTLTGDLVFGGTGKRIKADFSSTAPFSDRLYFQTTVANNYTAVGAIPSGTGTTAAFNAYNNSDPNNASSVSINCGPTSASLTAGKNGTGTYLPLGFLTSNTERMRIDTNGDVYVFAVGARIFGDFSNVTLANRVIFKSSVVDGMTMICASPNGTNLNSGFVALSSSDVGNSAWIGITASGAAGTIVCGKEGAGAYQPLAISVGGAERMRIGTNGNIGIGTTDTSTRLNVQSSTTGIPVLYAAHTNAASGQGAVRTELTNANNNTSSYHFAGTTAGISTWYLFGNGTMSFTSDERQKKNIETTRDGYAADLAKLRVVKYNWLNDDDSTPKELGLIAQEVEQIFPGLIIESELEGVGVRKGLKFSVLPFMMLKAIQELKAEVDDLRSKLPA